MRPPNETEIRKGERDSVWTTPSYDDHLIKLEKAQGNRDDKEWIFGMFPYDIDASA